MLWFLRSRRALRWGLGAGVLSLLILAAGADDSARRSALRTGNAQSSATSRGPNVAFLKKHCYDCHEGDGAEAGVDLAKLSDDLTDNAVTRRWVRIFDRVRHGEMPPPDSAKLPDRERMAFLRQTGTWISETQKSQFAEEGRVRGRRLTSREVERSLHDLLGIDIPLKDSLPQDEAATLFATTAEGQSISHFQLERHLAAVDRALDEAFHRALSPDDLYRRDFDAQKVSRDDPKRRTREPELLNGKAVVWSSGVIYYGRIPATTAPRDGWYRFRVRASGLNLPETGGVWTTVRAGPCVSSAPLLAWVGAFEAEKAAREYTFETWLPRGHMLEIRPGDVTLKRARFDGGQVGTGEGEPQNVAGIAIDRIVMEQIHRGPDDAGVRKLLFGDLELVPEPKSKRLSPVAKTPDVDAERLLTGFASRVFRRPAALADVAPYLEIVRNGVKEKESFGEALRAGYRAMLCSPRFLYLMESPGPLDDHALAARVSYFLTGSTPDAELRQLAEQGKLKDNRVLHAQVDRLLAGEHGRRFIEDFAAEWLDLDQIDFTTPDPKLFPDFDSIVQSSMLDETHAWLQTLLTDNLSVRHFTDSNFTYLNSRLARFYKIDRVKGDELQRVALRPEDRRGGLLTHGSILKVTANGTNTSPVVRGVWVCERILGEHIPPPPDSVPAIEPDIRGATTIREILTKHQSDASCASCHVKIDPPGFAMENFDPAGRWRDRYVQLVDGRVTRGAAIDAGGVLPGNGKFRDLTEFRRMISANPRGLAMNLADKLMTYGTGASVAFADREAIEQIVNRTSRENYGFRSLVHAVVESPTFRSK